MSKRRTRGFLAGLRRTALQLLRKAHLEGDALELLHRRISLLAQRYVESFDQKWVRESLPPAELLGTGDIQSLADLGNSYEIIREMHIIPFGLQDISRLAIATAAPLSPLLLTVFSFEELMIRVVKVAF